MNQIYLLDLEVRLKEQNRLLMHCVTPGHTEANVDLMRLAVNDIIAYRKASRL